MSGAVREALQAVAAGQPLGGATLQSAFGEMLDGTAEPYATSGLLAGLAVRGETADQLIAGARAFRERADKVDLGTPLLDTCGTGGLGWTSLNTSTAAALVVAACGGRVAKHGNRSVPPKTGSADVLEALGVHIDATAESARRCMEAAGIAFLYARAHHSAARHVAPLRQAMGIRTIFNLVGPLSNPAGATHQLLGVSQRRWLQPMAEALLELGIERAWVVHGAPGIDELSIEAETHVLAVEDGTITERTVAPEDAGLRRSPLSGLRGGSPEHNAKALRDALSGAPGPFADSICLNAGAALCVLGQAANLREGAEAARKALASGAALDRLDRLAAASQPR